MEHASSITQTRTSVAQRLREPAVRGAQLLAVSGFALAQPLFDILGKNAEFFAVRGSTPSDIVLFALVVTFAPALALLAVELAVGVGSRRAALVLHYVFLGGLGAVFGVQVLKRNGVDCDGRADRRRRARRRGDRRRGVATAHRALVPDDPRRARRSSSSASSSSTRRSRASSSRAT